MRTFIIQQGVSDTGKTTVIRMAYELTRERFPDAVESHAFHGVNDFRTVLEINGERIGIESYGDPSKKHVIERSLALYVELDCRLILCAGRTSGVTVETIEQFITPQDRVEWRQRRRINDHAERERVNNAEARWIVEQVQRIVSGR